jgi:hypothetical protein
VSDGSSPDHAGLPPGRLPDAATFAGGGEAGGVVRTGTILVHAWAGRERNFR